MRVLLISRDEQLTATISGLLRQQGFLVDLDAEKAAVTDLPLVAILDENLPPDGGFNELRRIRAASNIAVLMLLAYDSVDDRIASLEAGADDCLGRPFEGRELIARVRSVLRRVAPRPDPAHEIVEANGVRLVPASREVFCDGAPVATTTVEFEILTALLRAAGHPVSRDELMDNLYHRKATAFDRSIDMHVCHLRKKLSRGRALIKTVRGAGYQFCLAGDDAPASTSNR